MRSTHRIFSLFLYIIILSSSSFAHTGTPIADLPSTSHPYEDFYNDNMLMPEPDPFESLNRGMFEFNLLIDKMLIKPIAGIYRDTLHEEVRTGIHNVLQNLRAPLYCANFALQGEGKRSINSFLRFFLNTVFGIAGLFDVATNLLVPDYRTDFDETLARYKVPRGPYLMMPLLGPSNPRNLVSQVVEWVADPFNRVTRRRNWNAARYTRLALEVIDSREDMLGTLDLLEKNSFDLYATIRNGFSQKSLAKENKWSSRK